MIEQRIAVAAPKTAADVLREHATLEDALAAGRFAAQADDLRMYRRIAAMDAAAPVPPLPDAKPRWDEAAAFLEELGMWAVAGRVRAMGA